MIELKLREWTEKPWILRTKENQVFYKKYREKQWANFMEFHNLLSLEKKKFLSQQISSLAKDFNNSKPSDDLCKDLMKDRLFKDEVK